MPSKLLIGKATPATWNGNEEDLVPTDYTDKLAYFKKKYGSPTSDINEKSEAGAKTAEKKSNSENNKEKKLPMNPI